MNLPKRGEKGFTLIELLIVVAILGVLAAVIIPNVGRFMGRGEAEARRTERRSVEAAVIAMMSENGITSIPNPQDFTGNASNAMTTWPDNTSVCGSADKLTDADGDSFTVTTDKDGWILYGHDKDGDGTQTGLVNYVNLTVTQYYYTCEADGTVRQFDDAAKTTEYTT
jgi:type IV pilus assembly protein PilA